MKYRNIHKAETLADAREELFALRSAAVTCAVTISAGKTPILVTDVAALTLIDTLISRNTDALLEIGVSDVPVWQPPKRPPE